MGKLQSKPSKVEDEVGVEELVAGDPSVTLRRGGVELLGGIQGGGFSLLQELEREGGRGEWEGERGRGRAELSAQG